MISPRLCAAALMGAAMAAGIVADMRPAAPPLTIGGYRVLAADLHVHSFPLSWSTLAPGDGVREAQRHGLDVIAVAGHNHVWVPKLARWYARIAGGPRVLVSEEIVAGGYHMVAVGIESRVSWRLPAAAAIDEI